jgi:hypothetical protein
MSNFLSNIIGRNTGSENVLAPRVRGAFESRRTTFARPNIPASWQGNGESTVNHDSNYEYGLGESSMMGETPNAIEKIVDRKGAEKDNPAFSNVQNQVEQRKKIKKVPVILGDDGHLSKTKKTVAPTRQMQTIQQRVLERIRFEVPMDEKSVGGFSSDVPNRQAEQVIKPLLKTKAPFWQDATPRLQEGEGRAPSYSSKVNPKTDGSFSQHSATLNILGGAQHPSIAQPIIKVHIGRIEIKAVKETPVKQAKPQMPERRLSLDDFLKKRDNTLK